MVGIGGLGRGWRVSKWEEWSFPQEATNQPALGFVSLVFN